jgi:hypothetical protein
MAERIPVWFQLVKGKAKAVPQKDANNFAVSLPMTY